MTSSDSRDARRSRTPRSLEQRVADREERFRRAHAVAAEAVTVPPSERADFVASHPDCLCNEFAELMIGMAREFRSESPRDSVRCAHLAVAAVEKYAEIGGSDGEDVRALAWAELGNGHRILGDLRAAGMAFHHARQRVRQASDPLARAEVYSLEASYWAYRLEGARAERRLRQAERLQNRFGTTHAVGRLQLKRAEAVKTQGRLKEAIDLVESGLRRIEPRQEPALVLSGVHNLALYLILAGAYDTAMQILHRYRTAYEVFGDVRLNIRRTWLEAQALACSGRLELAETLYETARDQFSELDCPYEVALVLLDLTEIYAKTDRWPEVEAAAADTMAICRAHGVKAEGLAAARVLCEAARRRQANTETTVALVATIRQHLAPRPPSRG